MIRQLSLKSFDIFLRRSFEHRAFRPVPSEPENRLNPGWMAAADVNHSFCLLSSFLTFAVGQAKYKFSVKNSSNGLLLYKSYPKC